MEQLSFVSLGLLLIVAFLSWLSVRHDRRRGLWLERDIQRMRGVGRDDD